jgi:hypothetical protein
MSASSTPAAADAAKASSQGAITLWLGLKLSTMARVFRMGAEIHPSRWARLALLPGMAVYNSTMAAIESLRYSRKLRETQITQPPVFVLGHWRSGSTLLHNLITMDPQFSFVNLYQTMFPWHFLTTEGFGAKLASPLLPKTRPMDNMECRFDLPQEDEFALCVMTGYSPYLLPIFQHSPRKIDRFFDVQKGLDAHELQEWKDALMLLMKKVTLKTGKPIVLKSPSHTFRTKVLLEMFPDAKFVYIYRNPYAVLKSSVHFRKTIFEENALGKTQKEDMTDEVLNIYENCFRTYEADKTLVPKGNLHEICFEDLEADPLGQMKTMYESLNMSGFEGLQAVLEPQVESLRRYKKNKFTDDREVMQRIYNRLKFAFDRYGYPPPHLDIAAA